MSKPLLRRTMSVHPRYSFMKYQVGSIEKRIAKFPIFDPIKPALIIGFKDGPLVDIFNLVGFGETQEEAEKMADKNV
jgi:hypothetical protein